MTKTKLETFIKKYSLGGLLDEVRWTVKDGTLKVSEMTSDKKLLTMVEMSNFDSFGDAEFVIPATSAFKSKLSPLGEEIKIDLNAGEDDAKRIISLDLKDSDVELTYHTGMEDHLPPRPKLINIPNYEVEIVLTEKFIEKFLKAKSGFSDVNLLTLIMSKKKKKLEMVLGYSSNINTDRVALTLECVPGKDTISAPASFSASVLKEILSANSEVKEPVFKVSEQGLAHVEFVSDGFVSKYYMIKIPVED